MSCDICLSSHHITDNHEIAKKLADTGYIVNSNEIPVSEKRAETFARPDRITSQNFATEQIFDPATQPGSENAYINQHSRNDSCLPTCMGCGCTGIIDFKLHELECSKIRAGKKDTGDVAVASRNDDPFVCQKCYSRFNSLQAWDAHYRSCQVTRPVWKATVLSNNWDVAISNAVATDVPSRPKIPLRGNFPFLSSAQEPGSDLTGEWKQKRYKCQKCSVSFEEELNLLQHRYKVHQEAPPLCDRCGLPVMEHPVRHQNVCTGVAFKCPQCPRIFQLEGPLRSHQQGMDHQGPAILGALNRTEMRRTRRRKEDAKWRLVRLARKSAANTAAAVDTKSYAKPSNPPIDDAFTGLHNFISLNVAQSSAQAGGKVSREGPLSDFPKNSNKRIFVEPMPQRRMSRAVGLAPYDPTSPPIVVKTEVEDRPIGFSSAATFVADGPTDTRLTSLANVHVKEETSTNIKRGATALDWTTRDWEEMWVDPKRQKLMDSSEPSVCE